jgi:uncharacterized protein
MKELLTFILTNALGPDVEFSVDQSEDEQGIVFSINLPEEQRGKVIGKGGRNIKAIRDIMNVIARRENKRVFLKIAD